MLTHSKPIRVGISSCLLGSRVRFNGDHKRDRFATDILDRYFKWVAVCPEVEVGMGVPRESVRLVGATDAPAMIANQSGRDWTVPMMAYAETKAAKLKKQNLSGFILKSKSPTCGMERVRVYPASGMPVKRGVGLFARALMEAMPNLPIEEEGRLSDAHLRENFIVRVFCYHRWRQMPKKPFDVNHLLQFHTTHKLMLMAHSPSGLRRLGQIVAHPGRRSVRQLLADYESEFFAIMKIRATSGLHTNVLQHIAGYFKKDLAAGEKKELQTTVEDYRLGRLPLIVPLTLLRHHLLMYPKPYIAGQLYLNPHPKELMLLNHV